jgi:transcriptional regulator with XRE-family HTH domain
MTGTEIIGVVAANIRDARKAAGLSQEELALEAEVDRTYISQVERGKRNITIVVLHRLALAMRTTASKLMSDSRALAKDVKVRGPNLGVYESLSYYAAIPCLYSLYMRWWGDDWLSLTSYL